MDNLDEKVDERDHPKMKEDLMARLSEIEQKHIDWFLDREDKRTGKKPDRLENYYTFNMTPPRSYFGCGGYGLPRHISKECMDAYIEIFKSDNMQVFHPD